MSGAALAFLNWSIYLNRHPRWLAYELSLRGMSHKWAQGAPFPEASPGSHFLTDYQAEGGRLGVRNAEASLSLGHLVTNYRVWGFPHTSKQPGTEMKSCGVRLDKGSGVQFAVIGKDTAGNLVTCRKCQGKIWAVHFFFQ